MHRLVVVRFGYQSTNECIECDNIIAKVYWILRRKILFILVNLEDNEIFINSFSLYDPVSLIFFYRNRHVMIDFGTGDLNKVSHYFRTKDDLIKILEIIYEGVIKGNTRLYLHGLI